MTAAPLKAAVIGCGAIAYEHLPVLATSPWCELVAVCDRSEALARFAAERFAAAQVYTDAARMFAEARPDVVHILTPPHTHAALVREALASGAHVICEKPMTGSAQETAELLELARAAGRTLIESRNYLFNDPVITLRAMIAQGRLGDVVECDLLLSLDFLKGPFGDTNLSGPAIALRGGAIHDFLPHLAYIFQVLTGLADPDGADIRGFLTNRSGNPRAGFDFLDALVDAGKVRGRLRIGTDVQPDAFRVYLRGTQASLECDLYNPYFRYEGPPNIGKRGPLGQVRSGFGLIGAGLASFRAKVMQHGSYHGLPRMLDATYRAIAEGRDAPFSASEIHATARFVDGLLALGDQS